jgi:hypothetical protein
MLTAFRAFTQVPAEIIGYASCKIPILVPPLLEKLRCLDVAHSMRSTPSLPIRSPKMIAPSRAWGPPSLVEELRQCLERINYRFPSHQCAGDGDSQCSTRADKRTNGYTRNEESGFVGLAADFLVISFPHSRTNSPNVFAAFSTVSSFVSPLSSRSVTPRSASSSSFRFS